MFPVTLEFNNQVVTCSPPCYGFLRGEEWNEDSYFYSTGWKYLLTPYQKGIPQPFGTANLLHSSHPIGDHRYGYQFPADEWLAIWNSGTHYPYQGIEGGKVLAEQYHNGSLVYLADGVAIPQQDHVSAWAEENGRPDVTPRVVMELMQSWLDKDSESAILWHDDGFMGVEVDIPCDRALFYLMMNREMHTQGWKPMVYTYLDGIYKWGYSPMNAFLLSRLIAEDVDYLGEVSYRYYGSDNDSCIIPHSLITVGIGKNYVEPVQVIWEQDKYSAGDGHKRDEDLTEFLIGGSCVSSSLFMALMCLYEPPDSENLKTVGMEGDAVQVCFNLVDDLLVESAVEDAKQTRWGSFCPYHVANALTRTDHYKPDVNWVECTYNHIMGQ